MSLPNSTSLHSRSFQAMLIRRPQRRSWNQPNTVVPVPTRSPPSPKRWLEQDSGGAVGFGIVAALHKSIVASSPVNPIVSTSPEEITSPGLPRCREESRRHAHKTEKWRDKGFFCGSVPISSNNEIVVRSADFLSNCSVCRNQLHGKDVYMYQDKAFCSIDCRYQQMV